MELTSCVYPVKAFNKPNDWLSRQQILALTLIAVVYYLTARLGMHLQFEEAYASPIWPTSSIAIAAVLWLGYPAGVGILAGAFLANLTEFFFRDTGLPFSFGSLGSFILEHPSTLWSSFIIAIGHTLEALICLGILNTFKAKAPLSNVNNVSYFIVSALVACSLNASIAAYYYIDMNYLESELLYTVWFTWFSGDLIGILIATPFLLFFKIQSPIQYFYEKPLIHILSIALLLLICGLTFLDWSGANFFIAQSYLFVPLLVWINFKCGRTITLAVLLVSVIALWGTTQGHGPFAHENRNFSLILLQGFIASLLVTMLLQDAILKEREDALRQVNVSNEALKRSADLLFEAKQLADDKAMQAENDSKIKSGFLATMSHEIRTPLSGVVGMIDLMMDTNLDKEQEEYMATVKYSAESLLVVINDILDYSKVEAGKLVLEENRYQLDSIIQKSINTFNSELKEKNISLTYTNDPLMPQQVVGDSNRLNQVLTNLISNAIKFTSDGEINISSKLISSKKDFLMVELAIHDTGIGIHSDELNTIFDSFHQADISHTRRYGGSGLGLAIVKRLVEIMGGEIKVKSCPDKGSTFTFTTRLRKSSVSHATDAEYVPPKKKVAVDYSNSKVLLAEDNKINQIVTTRMLEKIGFEVDCVDNGKDAITAVQNNTYHLILMDCQMPVMDGFDATRKILELQHTKCIKDVPIIALTANAMAGDREKCIKLGMSDYLSKPLLMEELTSTVYLWLLSESEKKTIKDYIF